MVTVPEIRMFFIFHLRGRAGRGSAKFAHPMRCTVMVLVLNLGYTHLLPTHVCQPVGKERKCTRHAPTIRGGRPAGSRNSLAGGSGGCAQTKTKLVPKPLFWRESTSQQGSSSVLSRAMELKMTLLVTAFSLVAVVPGCSSLYYSMRPKVTISPGPGDRDEISAVGEYDPDYVSGSRKNVPSANLYVIDDREFGCPGYNHTNITLPSTGYFVMMLPYLGVNSPCLEYEKAQTIRNLWGASGLIFRYELGDPQGGQLRDRPSRSPTLSGITIVVVQLQYKPPKGATVSITAEYHQFQTSQTFYFIVFAFCILMLLSCLWFVMSYIKRCHYNVQRRRRRVSICGGYYM